MFQTAAASQECVSAREEPVCAMSVSVIIKWGGQEYSISSLSEEDTVMDLKQSIKTLTGVLPERQKLLGLKLKGERWFGILRAVTCGGPTEDNCSKMSRQGVKVV